MWVYTRRGLTSGLLFGSVVGLGSAIYYRRFLLIPIYGIAFSAAYGTFHLTSAYFRNEIWTNSYLNQRIIIQYILYFLFIYS